jgi:hypothetical protein
MPFSDAATKAAEDALWEFFSTKLKTAYFSVRGYRLEDFSVERTLARISSSEEPDFLSAIPVVVELWASEHIPCMPGQRISADIRKPKEGLVESVWVVFCMDGGEEIFSICISEHQPMNSTSKWTWEGTVPLRENIVLSY